MKAVVFQKNDGEQNLRREIRNMEEGCVASKIVLPLRLAHLHM